MAEQNALFRTSLERSVNAVENRTIRLLRLILCAAVLAGFVWVTAYAARCIQVTAITEGTRVIYRDGVYEEDFLLTEYRRGACLGRVDFVAYRQKYFIYAVKDEPEYLLINMGLDNRVYRRVETAPTNPSIIKVIP